MAEPTFWEYRLQQETLGQGNGLHSFPTKAYMATVQGVAAGALYGTFTWAYFPDKFAFSHKNTKVSGPSRGATYLNHTLLRPMVLFSVVGITFSGVESFFEEIRGSHQKDPVNSVAGGLAAGIVLGGFMTRRFDVASMTGLGLGLLMGMVEMNGPSVVCNPIHEFNRKFPATLPAKFDETPDLKELKEKYPKFANN